MKKGGFIGKLTKMAVMALIGVFSCVTLVACVSDNSEYVNSHSSLIADGANVRVMSSNVLTDKWGGDSVKSRAGTFASMLNHYSPDVVGVQEYCANWEDAVLGSNPNYSEIPIHDVGDGMTSIIYNRDKVNLISSGYQGFSNFDAMSMRYNAWGLFSTKVDGAKFIVTSTHWDFESANGDNTSEEKVAMRKAQAKETASLVKYLSDTFNAPVFATGDFNAIHEREMEGYAEYELLVEELGASVQDREDVDCKFAVEEAGRLVLGVKNDDVYNDGYYRYDHIFYFGDVLPCAFNILDDGMKIESGNPYDKMSDHASIYVDAKINVQS